jgi:hypothetical protein
MEMFHQSTQHVCILTCGFDAFDRRMYHGTQSVIGTKWDQVCD